MTHVMDDLRLLGVINISDEKGLVGKRSGSNQVPTFRLVVVGTFGEREIHERL